MEEKGRIKERLYKINIYAPRSSVVERPAVGVPTLRDRREAADEIGSAGTGRSPVQIRAGGLYLISYQQQEISLLSSSKRH